MSAVLEASRPCTESWNMDSPLNNPPTLTPYSPPTSRPSSSHVSTEWAQPLWCNSV